MHFPVKMNVSVVIFFEGILVDVLKFLVTIKSMSECSHNTLDSWLSFVHLDKMVIFFYLCTGSCLVFVSQMA